MVAIVTVSPNSLSQAYTLAEAKTLTGFAAIRSISPGKSIGLSSYFVAEKSLGCM
jgi:hypothetical protein